MQSFVEHLRAPAEKCDACGHHIENHESWRLAWMSPSYPYPPNVVRRAAKDEATHGCIWCGCRANLPEAPEGMSRSQAWW